MRHAILTFLLVSACDRSLDLGDRQHPVLTGSFRYTIRALPAPTAPRIGLVWLGPFGPVMGESVAVSLPLADYQVQLQSPPPESAIFHFVDDKGNAVAAGARALVFLFDDRDGDGRARVAPDLRIAAPDRALGVALSRGLLYWVQPPLRDGRSIESPKLDSIWGLAMNFADGPAPTAGYELARHQCFLDFPWSRDQFAEAIDLDLTTTSQQISDGGCHVADVINLDVDGSCVPQSLLPDLRPPDRIDFSKMPGEACAGPNDCVPVCCVCPDGSFLAAASCDDEEETCADPTNACARALESCPGYTTEL